MRLLFSLPFVMLIFSCTSKKEIFSMQASGQGYKLTVDTAFTNTFPQNFRVKLKLYRYDNEKIAESDSIEGIVKGHSDDYFEIATEQRAKMTNLKNVQLNIEALEIGKDGKEDSLGFYSKSIEDILKIAPMRYARMGCTGCERDPSLKPYIDQSICWCLSSVRK